MTHPNRLFTFAILLLLALAGCDSAADPSVDEVSTIKPESPAAPASLTLSVETESIALAWKDAADNESGFVIERKVESGEFIELARPTTDATSYKDTAVEAGTTYTYRVAAWNEAGQSAWSNEAEATLPPAGPTDPPAAPGGLLAVTQGTAVQLTWNDLSDDEDGFSLERKTGAGTFAKLTGFSVGATSYIDATVTEAGSYAYRVLAYNAHGDSAYSNEASVAMPLNAPSGLTATVSLGNIALYWNDESSLEDDVRVERKVDAGAFEELAVLAANAITYVDSAGIVTDTVYTYRVSVSSATIQQSEPSNEAKAWLPSPGMAFIPGGCFMMGDSADAGIYDDDELPVHEVCVSAFEMDTHEVTNADYKACFDADAYITKCHEPNNIHSRTRNPYYGNSPTHDTYPVVWIDQDRAIAYCRWLGKRLPTEAEWEYAARGGLEGKRYLWGDTISSADAKYYSGVYEDTVEVGSYAPNGYGLYDMAGNVSEWTHDRYSATYYSVSPTQDPKGPISGDSTSAQYVIRGGSFLNGAHFLRVASRVELSTWTAFSNHTSYQHGFRCVDRMGE